MVTDYNKTDIRSSGESEPFLHQPVHLHLRARQGVYALYGTPFPLRLCVEILQECLQARYFLLLSFSNRQLLARPNTSLAQWLRQQGLQAHSIRAQYALVPVQQLHNLAELAQEYLVFTDTSLSPDQLAQIDIETLAVDTFSSTAWHTVLWQEVGNRLYWESRDDRFSHLLCADRQILAGVLSRFLRAYIRSHQPEVPFLEDFPPLIHEQLWQYAGQGLAPGSVTRTPNGVDVQVALGTPDRSVCVLVQSCAHTSQIRRGFLLRWQDGAWELCSTEGFNGNRH